MNLKLFKKRLRGFYTHWNKHKEDIWGGSDVILLYSPPSTSSSRNPISSAFLLWLLGYTFSDTIAIFTSKEIHFVCTSKQKASHLKTLVDLTQEAVQAQLIVHVTKKTDHEGNDMITDEILSAYRLQSKLKYLSCRVLFMNKSYRGLGVQNYNGPPMVVGFVVGESPPSELLWGSSKKEKSSEFQTVDVNNGLSKFGLPKAELGFQEKQNEYLGGIPFANEDGFHEDHV